MNTQGTAARGVTDDLASAVPLLTGHLATETATEAESPADDFRSWIWADDDDADALGELHRRKLRDTARRLIDREADTIARGGQPRDLAWLAQEIPEQHPRYALVRALARQTGTPLTPQYPNGDAARRHARRVREAAHLGSLLQQFQRAAAHVMRSAHHRSAAFALRLAQPWRRATTPRAPACPGLA